MGNQPDRAIVKQPVMTYFYNSNSGGWSKKKGSRKLETAWHDSADRRRVERKR